MTADQSKPIVAAVNREAIAADRAKRAGYAVMCIARLIDENEMRTCEEGEAFLNSFTRGGLTTALELIGSHLCDTSERALDLIEREGT